MIYQCFALALLSASFASADLTKLEQHCAVLDICDQIEEYKLLPMSNVTAVSVRSGGSATPRHSSNQLMFGLQSSQSFDMIVDGFAGGVNKFRMSVYGITTMDLQAETRDIDSKLDQEFNAK